MNEISLLAAGALKNQCSESVMGYCSCIGSKFTKDETLDGFCPMCGNSVEVFVCSRCNGKFSALPVNSEHACQSVSVYRASGKIAFQEAEIAAREAKRHTEAIERAKQVVIYWRAANADGWSRYSNFQNINIRLKTFKKVTS